MSFVVSESVLRPLARSLSAPSLSLQVTDEWTEDYEAIWRAQGAVRTVVDFLARNIASLSPKLYERVSDTDRTRITDHPLADLLSGEIVAGKCKVPHMYRFELLGTPDDVETVREGLDQFWQRHSLTPA